MKDTTHFLKCRQQYGANYRDYVMPCNILATTKSGKMLKIEVFGYRNYIGYDDKRQVKYVEPHRVVERLNKN